MTGHDPTPEADRARLRQTLRELAAQRATITYRDAASAIGLAPPHVIQHVAALLEELMAEDAAAGRPFIAALVVGRARGGLPAPGFFEAAARLGRFPGDPGGVDAAAWHAAELGRAHAFHAASDAPPR
ncbi:MAG TPA: hypothetical protein VFN28_00620 [Amaricoccus sp.]|nr:hypothetical protein [Amaricoccus sp.]